MNLPSNRPNKYSATILQPSCGQKRPSSRGGAKRGARAIFLAAAANVSIIFRNFTTAFAGARPEGPGGPGRPPAPCNKKKTYRYETTNACRHHGGRPRAGFVRRGQVPRRGQHRLGRGLAAVLRADDTAGPGGP